MLRLLESFEEILCLLFLCNKMQEFIHSFDLTRLSAPFAS